MPPCAPSVQPLLEDLAFDDRAVLFVGEPGSGHFSKLIHNAIEFGMVQAIAEGVVKLVGTDFAAIVAEGQRLLDDPAAYSAMARGVSPYGDGKASQRIVERLARDLL